MRSVDQALADACLSNNRAPISRVTLEVDRLSFSNMTGVASSIASWDMARTTSGAVAIRRTVSNALDACVMTPAQITGTWPSWTGIIANGEYFPIDNSDVAVSASGDTVDAFYFNQSGLCWKRSTNGGSTFSGATVIATVTSDGWLHCGTTSPGCVAWVKPYSSMTDGRLYYDVMLSIYGTDQTWHTYTWTLRQKIDFNNQDMRVSVAKIGSRYLVVYSGVVSGKDTDIGAIWFYEGIWSNPKVLAQLDTSSSSSYCKAPMLSFVGNYLWLFYAMRIPLYSDSTDANQVLACMHTQDGDNWSEMDILVNCPNVVYAKLLTVDALTVLLYHQPSDVDKKVFRWVSPGISLTGNLHPDNVLDISGDVLGWNLDLPQESSAQSEVTLSNSHLRYATIGEKEHTMLMSPCKLIIEGGYNVSGIDYYTTMATHDLYIPEHTTSFVDNQIKLTGADYSARAELWIANREHMYDSQHRLFDNLQEQKNTAGIRGLWKGTGNGLEGYLSGLSIVPEITSKYMQLVGHVSIDGQDAPVGTEILAVSPRGNVVGGVTVSSPGDISVLCVYQEEVMSADQKAIASYMTTGQYSGDPGIIPGMKPGEAIKFIVGNAATASGITFTPDTEGYSTIDLVALTTNPMPDLTTTIRRAQAMIVSSSRPYGILRYRFKLVGSNPTGRVGVGLDISNDVIEKESGYIVVYDKDDDKFKIYKETHSYWGNPVATQGSTVGLDVTSWLHVMVHYWYGEIKVFYSKDDGVTWSLALSYTDSDPFEFGGPNSSLWYCTFELQGITSDGVWFADMTFSDMDMDWSLGSIVKSICWKSGIESVEYDDDLYDTFSSGSVPDAATWPYSVNLTASIASGFLHCIGVSATATPSGMRSSLQEQNFIGSMVIKPGSGNGGFLFDSDANIQNAYMATISSSYVYLYRIESGAVSLLYKAPLPYTPDAFGSGIWQLDISRQEEYVGLWLNGQCVLSYYTPTAATESTNYIGLAVRGTAEVDFDEVRIIELDDYIETHIISVGEGARRAFDDLMGKRHIRWFINGDGAMRASRFANRVVTVSYEDSILESTKTPSDKEWFSHVQVVGAKDVGDRINIDTVVSKGYRFVKVDNPDVMTPKDAFVEAQTIQTESEERSNLREFSAPAVVQQERQDLIEIINVKDGTNSSMSFTVQALSYSYELDMDKAQVVFDMTLQGTIALERVKKIFRDENRSAYISAKIIAINTVTRSINVQIYGSRTVIKNVSVPLSMSMDELHNGDLVLLAQVNGVYFVLQAYKEITPTEPYRWHWYADGTLPGDAEVLWDNDTCSTQGRIAFWG